MNPSLAMTSMLTEPDGDFEHGKGVPGLLRRWQRDQALLSFLYSRSMGGLIHSGRAKLSSVDSGYLQLSAEGSRLIVVIRNAKYSLEPQLFFNPGFSASRKIPGVSIQLENFDWLFLTTGQDNDLLQHFHVLPSK